jgi:hypothetical protein
MEASSKPLYVRLPMADAARLDDVAASTGISKRQLVSDAVRQHLRDDGLQVGRISLLESSDPFPPDRRSSPEPPASEVLTLPEVALLLRLDEASARASAERGELPGRCVGGEWRFSRAAVIDWLAGPSSAPR